MIGDNLSTDILGGNTIAKSNQEHKNNPRWVTVAVKSGVYQDTDKDQQDIAGNPLMKPNHVVKDFEAAVKLIQVLERT